jgi:hypothetical protein
MIDDYEWIFFWNFASTVDSQELSHLSTTTATSGLTSKFGKGLGRTLTLRTYQLPLSMMSLMVG